MANMKTPTTSSTAVRRLFFWVGILATLCYRAIIFFTNANPVVLRVIWYVGTVGFVVYFLHRYQVSTKRARVIEQLRLTERVDEFPNLSDDERAGMRYVFSTLRSSREKWNYYVIFASSAIAIIFGLWMDLK